MLDRGASDLGAGVVVGDSTYDSFNARAGGRRGWGVETALKMPAPLNAVCGASGIRWIEERAQSSGKENMAET